MSKHLWRPCLATGLILGIGACCGCGAKEYQQRMAAGLEQVRQGSAFNELLYDAADLEGTQVSVRVPKVFKQSFKEGSAIGGKPVDPRRVKPPKVDLTEFNIAYEALAPASGGKVAYYCYLGAATSSGGKAADPTNGMAMELQDKFPNGTGDWEEVRLPTPEGRVLTWKKIRATGTQEFYYVDNSNKASFKAMPGILEVYYHQAAGSSVVVCWRVPTALGKSTNFSQLAALLAGSITVKQKE